MSVSTISRVVVSDRPPLLPAYRGISSFPESAPERALFFGREQEAQEVFDLVVAEPLVVVFSRSGLGKTSLLTAKVMPKLETYGFLPVRIRVTHDLERGPVASTLARVREATKLLPEVEHRVASTELRCENEDSLWEYFYENEFHRDGRQLRPVLIFDQFEELFTLVRPANAESVERFVDQVADLVRRRVPADLEAALCARLNDMKPDDPARADVLKVLYEGAGPDVRVVLVMREEFLPELHSLRSNLPSVYKSSYRLQGLTLADARESIEKPAAMPNIEGGPFSYEPSVVDEILERLRTVRRGKNVVRTDRIDPIQLQIFCRYLDQRRQKKRRAKVTLADLSRWTVTRAAEAYYLQIIRRIDRYRLGWNRRFWRPSLTNFWFINKPRAAVARLCEDGLITAGGRRNSLDRDTAIRKYGVAPRDLDRLQKERLISVEPRLDSEFIELSHDALVRPLQKRKQLRPYLYALQIVGALALLLIGATVAERGAAAFARRELASSFEAAATPAERAARVRTALESASSDFRGIELAALELAGFDFSGRQLQDTKWRASDLSASEFSHAALDDADFTGARAENASFATATLTSAKFAGAILTRADFEGATLTDADFSGARLDYVNFHHADLRGAKFDQTAWWLACGYSETGVKQLQARYPYRDHYRTTQWSVAMTDHTAAVNAATDDLARADALNNRAWLRATHGFELRDALADVDRALQLRPEVDEFHDTRGYVLLQLGNFEAAEASLAKSTDGESTDIGMAERQYHHALALERLGQDDRARRLYRQAIAYKPCYEALLTPQRLSLAAPAAGR